MLDATGYRKLLKQAEGKQAMIAGTGRKDYTEEARLKEIEERYISLFNNSPDAIYYHDFKGNFIDANDPGLRMLGYKREDIPTVKVASLVSEDQLPLAKEILKRLEEGSSRAEVAEFTLRGKDGSTIEVEISTTVIYRDGRPVYCMGIARDITQRKKTEARLQRSYKRLQKAMEGVVQTIGMISEVRDPYTSGHQQQVATLAAAIAGEMGLSENQVMAIRMAGALHDIGKINIPAEILSKPSKLSEIEFDLIRTHPAVGREILKNIDFPWPVCKMVLQHHERLDGSGYPDGLRADDICLEAKILAVADVVDAMTFHRPYRPARGIDDALEEITKNRGILYDPDVVDACLRLFNEKGFKLA